MGGSRKPECPLTGEPHFPAAQLEIPTGPTLQKPAPPAPRPPDMKLTSLSVSPFLHR